MDRGYAAYGGAHRASLKGRALEGESFMKAVNLLQRAQDFVENKRLYFEALEYSRKLWLIVQADLGDPTHHLDAGLKAKLLSLAQFVERQAVRAAENPTAQNLQSLIDVNLEVARGLLGTR